MTTRDELADLIYRTMNPEIQQDAGWLPTVDGTGNVVSHIAADAILTRWRLVPVDSAPYVEPDADQRPREWHAYDCGALYGDKPHWHYT